MITRKEAFRIRLAGNVLFLLYLLVLTYFLFFSERYGRKAAEEAVRYNLVPLREIRRFWEMRHVLGMRVSMLNHAEN